PPFLALAGAADLAQVMQCTENLGQPLQIVVERGGAAFLARRRGRRRRLRPRRRDQDKGCGGEGGFEHRGYMRPAGGLGKAWFTQAFQRPPRRSRPSLRWF